MTYRDHTATEVELERRLRDSQREVAACRRWIAVLAVLLGLITAGAALRAQDAASYRVRADACETTPEASCASLLHLAHGFRDQRDQAWEALDTCIEALLYPDSARSGTNTAAYPETEFIGPGGRQ